MIRTFLLSAILVLGFHSSTFAKTNEPASLTENRYLLIIESSAETAPMKEAVKNVTLNLVITGMDGRLQEGDTLGLWSFGPELEVANISMQRWSTSGPPRKVIVKNTSALLNELKFKKASNFSKVTPALLSVAKSSRRLIIALISSGKETPSGTPFDQEIYNIVTHYRKDLRDSKIPFVIFLAVHQGEFIGYSVNSAMGPFQIPRLPAEPKPVEPPKVAVVEPPPQVFGENIQIQGKKTVEPVETPVPTPTPQEIIPAPVQPIPVAVEAPKPAPAVALPVPAEPEPAAPVEVATPVESTPEPETNKVIQPIQATAQPPTPPGSQGAWAPYAGALLLGLAVIAFVLGRRSNKPASPSLISRSMHDK